MAYERISIDPAVMLGKPCIAGKRITVEHILRQLAGGMLAADIVRGHPRLKLSDVAAAQSYAAGVLAMPSVSSQLAAENAPAG